MSSLLNNASLLLNPAGSIISYQEDKIYSVLPRNGTGDFTFSGGDGGTRVNQQGYIEVTPANLINQSEAIGSSPWILNFTTVTTNSTVAPNGTTTADTIANDGTNAFHRVYQGAFTGYGSPQTMSFSLYVKYNNHQYFSFGLTDDSVYRSQVVVDLINGTITQNFVNTGGDTLTSTITNVGGGWYYVTGTFTYATSLIGGNAYFLCMLLNQSTFTSAGYVGTGTSVFVWGAMFNTGGVKPYQPTTDRLNYPRITYQNGRGALLGELQRTNYALYSNSCAWTTQVGASLTFSSSISPDGTQNATTLNVGTGNYSGTYYYVNRGFEKAIVSIFAKAGTLPYLYFLNTAGNTAVAWYDLRNGTVSNVNGSYSAYMEPYKDGWYRCVLSGPTQNNVYIQLGATDISGNFAASYVGSIQIWGGQNEVGTYDIDRATSYIPTTTATVTRPSDIPYVSGISSLVGQSSGGTLYVSGVPRASEEEFVAITPGGYTTVDGVYIYYTSGNNLRLWVVGGSTVQVGGNSANINVGQYFKAAVRYGNGSTAYYVNGQQIVTTAAALAFSNTLNRIDLRGNAYYYSTPGAQEISTVATYPTGLTNTQLQELTTVRSGSGGTISYYGPYTIHTFTGSATFTPSFSGEVEVLVVAGGGGGGGWYYAGGGGAGGVLYASSFGVSQGTGITVTVGAGGAQQTGNSQPGNDGSASSFGGLSAVGGGGGGGGYPSGPAGRNGGSGGGGGRGSSYSGGLGISGQGNNGGNYNGWAGGGGGAGEAGATGANNANPGNGGDGLPYSITGFSTYYGGGGAGAVDANIDMPETVIPQGGLGGGGNGATYTNLNTAAGTGVTNTGGGGGGGCHAGANPTGAAGGSGIVIVRYLT